MKNTVQLVTYADRLGDGTLASMTEILRTRFAGVYDGVHILPFFTPFDGADAGFDPIDHTTVDPRLGSWDDVAELSRTHGVMVDAIVNHMSWQSVQFQDVMAKGDASAYAPMFLTMSSVFPEGATEEELAGIYRPRPGLPFTHYTLGGKTRLVWTTFTPQQVDIDTDSAEGWDYLMSIFDRMAASHVSYLRLDAVGYGAKDAHSSCFMTPKTFELISRLREEGVKRGLEILIEVHSYYKKQVEIASKVDRVYDFALPPLLLHSLFTGQVQPLAHWVRIRPTNAVTVLDTHDGIGVIDIGSDQLDRSLKGLVPDADVDAMVETIHANTHGESKAATGAAASNLDLYQVNSTYYSALGCNDQHYIAARAVQFFLPGVPQVYYVGALAGANDMDLLARTNNGRDINRHYYSTAEIDENLGRPVVQALNALARFRNTLDAFDGEFSWSVDESVDGSDADAAESLTLTWRGATTSATLTFTPQAGLGTDNPAPVASLTWTDAAGEHRTDDLIAAPPVVAA
ncbi:sucrose phosphorylase [Bifidobacterium pullorum subsp. saeculare]|uniref:Sucrose phosphorylase n=1 Tax=Bifidobacterium pullorum subsp. saeculare TaxID=78257 RepID=A0A938X0J4_9BIFI|nr:sucrose phosphorylase [Bifidobacterium pullorum]MBM6700463.1 sucrose phosphorylase [Bifidobacterium pullorum subsp. saeculare]